MKESIEINGRRIGNGEPVYVIAEMSANHGQDFEQAVQIIRAAAAAGADSDQAANLHTGYDYDPIRQAIFSGRWRHALGWPYAV